MAVSGRTTLLKCLFSSTSRVVIKPLSLGMEFTIFQYTLVNNTNHKFATANHSIVTSFSTENRRSSKNIGESFLDTKITTKYFFFYN